MVLADSNILIYATQPEHPKLRQWLLDTLPKVSVISRVEILGYHKLQETEQIALAELLDNLELVYLTPACYEIAIQLRQQQKLTLGNGPSLRSPVWNSVTPWQQPTSGISAGFKN